MKPPQLARDFEVDAVLDAEELSGPGAALPEHAGAVRLVDHETCSESLTQVADLGKRRDVAFHREHAVDDDEHAATVAGRACQRFLELVEAVVTKRAQLRAREKAAVEDRGVVAGVGDNGVAGSEDRP
jgi:hypothetical protein